MDHNARVLIWVGSSLGCDGVGLVTHWFSRVDATALEDYRRITKYEVNCPVNVTFFVKLTFRIDIKSVLVAFETTFIKD